MGPETKKGADAKKWVSESTRGALYGVCFLVAGVVGAILAHKHDLPTEVQIYTVGVGLFIGAGMMSESNFYVSRKYLRKLQNPETKSE